jgi:protein required for attachment to host cells
LIQSKDPPPARAEVAAGEGETSMSGLSIRDGEWVVVCDGAKALVLQNNGDAKFPNLKTIEVFEQKDLATHEQGSDAPGRAVNSVGNMRSSVEQTDWHDQAERQFLAQLVRHLEAAVTAGKTKSLVMIAPPRALGMLRPAYSNGLRGAIRAELDKDLVKVPVHEIERRLSSH